MEKGKAVCSKKCDVSLPLYQKTCSKESMNLMKMRKNNNSLSTEPFADRRIVDIDDMAFKNTYVNYLKTAKSKKQWVEAWAKNASDTIFKRPKEKLIMVPDEDNKKSKKPSRQVNIIYENINSNSISSDSNKPQLKQIDRTKQRPEFPLERSRTFIVHKCKEIQDLCENFRNNCLNKEFRPHLKMPNPPYQYSVTNLDRYCSKMSFSPNSIKKKSQKNFSKNSFLISVDRSPAAANEKFSVDNQISREKNECHGITTKRTLAISQKKSLASVDFDKLFDKTCSEELQNLSINTKSKIPVRRISPLSSPKHNKQYRISQSKNTGHYFYSDRNDLQTKYDKTKTTQKLCSCGRTLALNLKKNDIKDPKKTGRRAELEKGQQIGSKMGAKMGTEMRTKLGPKSDSKNRPRAGGHN